jgi:hypothetical protein
MTFIRVTMTILGNHGEIEDLSVKLITLGEMIFWSNDYLGLSTFLSGSNDH